MRSEKERPHKRQKSTAESAILFKCSDAGNLEQVLQLARRSKFLVLVLCFVFTQRKRTQAEAQAQGKGNILILVLAHALCLCLRQPRFHDEISALMFELVLVLASLVKTNQASASALRSDDGLYARNKK